MTIPAPENADAAMRAAQKFTKMAEQLQLNRGEGFAGAAVIVHPDGQEISLLMLGTVDNSAQFFVTLGQRIQSLVAELDEKAKRTQAFGHR